MQWKSLLTDRQIVARVLAGRTNDFEILVQRHLPMAQAVAYAQLGQRPDAEDVVQEGFVKAYTGLDGLQQPERFRSWLATIVRNLAMTVLRKEARDAKASPALAQTETPHPAAEIERRDLLSVLEGEINQLDEPYREVLLMHYFSGMKVREVADALDISKEVAAKRLQRGRHALSERVLGVLDTAATAEQPNRSARTKTIMGLVAATPEAWRSAAAGAGVATAVTSFGLKTAIVLVVLASTITGVYLLHRSNPVALSEPVVPSTEPGTQSAPSIPSDQGTLSAISVAPSSSQKEANARPTGIGVISGAVLQPDGAPVDGASIRVEIVDWSDSGGNPVHYRYENAADANGRFRIENLPLERAWITAGVPGRLAGVRVVGLTDDFPEWFVWLETEPAARIAGRVVDRSGQPVAEARVTPCAWNSDDLSGWNEQALETPETSDANGRFAFELLRPGTWAFEVTAPEYAPCISDQIPAGTTDAEIVLASGGSLSGMAVAADSDQPVADGTVRLYPADRFLNKVRAEIAADGTFRFDHLTPGKYALTYVGATDATPGTGYYLSERLAPVDVRGERDTPFQQLILEPGAAVSGVVTGADGLPCSDCTVAGSKDNHSTKVQTDKNGRYRIAGLAPGDCVVTVYPRYPASEQSVVLEAGKSRENLDFQYPQGVATITGVVTDNGGSPLPGVEVTALDQYWSWDLAKATTGNDGTFRIENVPPSDMLWLRAKKPGWVGQDIMTRLTERGIDGVTMTMAQPATILGKVVDDAGMPVENVTMWHRGVDISVYTATSSKTTKGGRFAFAGLVPGDYRLLAEPEGSAEVELGHVQVKPGEVRDDVTLVLPATSGLEIAGTVVDASHNPIAGAFLNIYSLTGSHDTLHTRTDRFGRFVFAGLQESAYRLLAWRYGYGTTELKQVEAGQQDLEVQLVVTGSIEGRVLSTGSADPVTKFYVNALDGDRTMIGTDDKRQATLVSNDSGAYSLTNVDAGTHTVAAWAEGFAPAYQQVEVLPGQTVQNVVLWLAPERPPGHHDAIRTTIRGRVVDNAGKPVENASLFLDDLPSVSERIGLTVARTDADGQFVIEDVPQDTRLIVATGEGYGPGGTEFTGSLSGLTIALPDGGTINGTVCEDGEPIAGEFVVASFNTRGYEVDESAHTDVTGAYTIDGIPEGPATVYVWRTVEGTQRKYFRDVVVNPGHPATADIDFRSGSSAIAGVLLVDGSPVRGRLQMQLTTKDGSTSYVDAFANNQGAFRLAQLPPSTIQVEATTQIDDVVYKANETLGLTDGELVTLELNLVPSTE